ncbi:MAG: hypothetical protein DRG78_12145 [Epsilonproteobacteria bacterium]|nr:MAG: hypothetical protein DRG78_12145 [Campylobacterota bacterium]
MNLITSLSIKNFFSIKNKVHVNFKASPYNIDNNKERLFLFNNNYYNKVISFYGPNASGKTTCLKALIVLFNVANHEQVDDFTKSFKNKFADINDRSEIDITFIINDNNNYREFSYKLTFEFEGYSNTGINNEILTELINGKEIILFNRKEKIIQNVADNIMLNIFNDLSPTKSLFTEFEKFEETTIIKQIRHFFKCARTASNIGVHNTRLNTNSNDEYKIGLFLNGLKNEIDKGSVLHHELNLFFLSFFKSINIDIEKIEAKFDNKNDEGNEFLGIEIFHKINKKEPLEFKFESDGTQMLMKLLLDIFMIKHTKSILILDEFDSIIHPMLTPIIINLLIKNNIQTIYSTHNIYNMKFLQNDEIFLIEKDLEHKTTINAVKDNSDIKGFENLLTYYENGYLGGTPNITNLITKIV